MATAVLGLCAIACSTAPPLRADLVGEYETWAIDERSAIELRADGTFVTHWLHDITQLTGRWSCDGDALRLEREQWLGAGASWRPATADDEQVLPSEWRVRTIDGVLWIVPVRELDRGWDERICGWSRSRRATEAGAASR